MYPLKITEKYNLDKIADLLSRFTTLYLWNYIPWDFSTWTWSHTWVDIIPCKTNDDVFCILDWIIEEASKNSYNWNFVVIKHENAYDPDDFSKKTTLYSCYLHLSELWVEKWQKVNEWDTIWKTWNTWNSYWEHLHFQIDRKDAPWHPYWPFSTQDTIKAWVDFIWAVNIWLWLINAIKYTIDPLTYLDNLVKWKISPKAHIDNDIKYFADINNSYEYHNYLNKLWSEWKIKWYDDKTFRPNENITRKELLKFLFILSSKTLKDDSKKYFSDVEDTDWFKKYVNSWVNYGILSIKNNTFRPNDFISKTEALKIILLLFVWEISTKYVSKFDDIVWNEWFAKYVEYCIKNKLIDVNWKLFKPNDFIKRGEVISIIYRIKKK
jgi:hypothetical protein